EARARHAAEAAGAAPAPGATAATAASGAANEPAPGRPAIAAAPAAGQDADEDSATEGGFLNWDAKDCAKVHSDVRWLEPPLRDACRRFTVDHGRSVIHAFVGSIPKAMFVFMPLIAAAMLLLYWFPRRYYVEHLVFVLHNHSALFLTMVAEMLVAQLARALPALHGLGAAASTIALLYTLWYLWRAMRRYYGQGRLLTGLKLATLFVVYFAFLAITLAGTFLLSALVA
ncbi:MAG: hypothetical protein JSR54_16430, partial [Proteobacteria bacterium]|nr:hypothetical protein [Pseudomonadota bacterium]